MKSIWRGINDSRGDRHLFYTLPMSDGGDGFVDVFLDGGEAALVQAPVTNALGEPVIAIYARSHETAILELAAASGLAQLEGRVAPRTASTFGTGQLIRNALDRGATRIVLAIGGSATVDGGAGALAALGARFLNAAGAELEPTPAALNALAEIDVSAFDARLAETEIEIACDVTNPLLGPAGAAAVFGPQKGANAVDIDFLEQTLARIADAAVRVTGRDLRAMPGAGAAGGIGWAFATFFGATLRSGFDIVAERRGLARALEGADVCFTGEGRIDMQSLDGKVVGGVARLAAAAGVPLVCAIGGRVDADAAEALRALNVQCVALVDQPYIAPDQYFSATEWAIQDVTERWTREHWPA